MQLLTKNKNTLNEKLHKIAQGFISPRDVLFEIEEEQLTDLLSPNFVKENEHPPIGQGESILPGDVSGQLVLDRRLGSYCYKKRKVETQLLT
ncbi:hypothetical protein AM232_07280 [Bacillus sp. FJAT-21352]|nr:hypothetical protein AM232_07280 [Bacillus sp. FJAT-21352]